MTLVDGAQSCGALVLDLHDLGCDFFTASAHKWLVGPKEVGLLYVRRDRASELWAADVGVGWERARQRGARKFENLGQRDDARVAAMGPTVAFHERLGRANVQARVYALASAVREGLRDAVPNVVFHTPRERSSSAGVVVFRIPGLRSREAFQALYRDHGVGCAAMGGHFEGLRLSPHVYNTMEDVARVVDAVASLGA